jgi:predicted Zn-dependent peptidase
VTQLALLIAALSTLLQGPQESPEVPNTFSSFETAHLSNGLKVWFKRLPDEPVVSISVALPFGADQDPPGKEQLAHFTEHMLFSDQPGLTEEEIKRQIEALGGVYNASVTADRTFYFVRIGKEHALFALEWLYRILAPHAMSPEVVEGQREPVALEVRARPRQLFDWIWALYLNPPVLRLPGFWEREFGVETLSSRDYYPYVSLYSIDSDDLRWFYETYYVPSLMTLTIIGDLERDSVFRKVDETFASLPQGEEPDTSAVPIDPNRYRQSIFWVYRSNVYYNSRFKFYNLDAEREAMLIFLARFLSKRLNDELRFGEQKATYGIRVGIVKRGRAAYLYISGGIKEEEFDYARGVVKRELEALRAGSLSESEFEADRAAVARQLRVTNSSSEDLEGWVRGYFYDPRIHSGFPDLVARFDSVSLWEAQAFVREHFVPERQVLTLIRPHPINQILLVFMVAAIVWMVVQFAAGWMIQSVDMTRIRYVARFRTPRLYRLATSLLLLALVAILGRTLVFGFEVLVDRVLLRLDSFTLQWSAYGAMLAVTVLLSVMVLAHIPRRLLVFDDRLLIKYLSFRSVSIPASEVRELSLERFSAVWLTKRLWKCVPLALGLFGPAVYLRGQRGWAYYFNVRDKTELLRLLEDIVPHALAAGASDSDSEDPRTPG